MPILNKGKQNVESKSSKIAHPKSKIHGSVTKQAASRSSKNAPVGKNK